MMSNKDFEISGQTLCTIQVSQSADVSHQRSSPGQNNKNTKSPPLPVSGKVPLRALILWSHPEKLFKLWCRSRIQGKQQDSFSCCFIHFSSTEWQKSERCLEAFIRALNSKCTEINYPLWHYWRLHNNCNIWYNHLLSQALTLLMLLTSEG